VTIQNCSQSAGKTRKFLEPSETLRGGNKLMKETVRRLLQDFNNLPELLLTLRKERQMSFKEISDYFCELNYQCSRSLIKRLFTKLEIEKIIRTRDGNKNSFFGKKHTEETKKHLSERAILDGRCRGSKNYFYGKSGELSPAWRGGTSTKRAILYASEDWKNKRLEVFKLDSFTCKLCGYTPENKRNTLNAHHIIPLHLDWNLCLETNNIITLCVTCHKKTFNKEKYFINIFQDIVRTSRRLDDGSRNDYHQQNNVE
jgi:hypothetical protein